MNTDVNPEVFYREFFYCGDGLHSSHAYLNLLWRIDALDEADEAHLASFLDDFRITRDDAERDAVAFRRMVELRKTADARREQEANYAECGRKSREAVADELARVAKRLTWSRLAKFAELVATFPALTERERREIPAKVKQGMERHAASLASMTAARQSASEAWRELEQLNEDFDRVAACHREVDDDGATPF